ncbi:MAG: hypothetical protein ACYC1U_04220 [Candidatus Aquicultorales bacterium]
MLPKEQVLGIWQKYSKQILSQPERAAFYASCSPLQRFDEGTLRTAMNFAKKENDFSIGRIVKLARAVKQGNVGKILKRSEKDLLIAKIICARSGLVPVARLDQRFREMTADSDIELTYTEVERAWRIAALTLAEQDERWKGILKPVTASHHREPPPVSLLKIFGEA